LFDSFGWLGTQRRTFLTALPYTSLLRWVRSREFRILRPQAPEPSPRTSRFSSSVRATLRTPLPFIALAAITHLVLGLVLLPGWMFSKYPDFAQLLLAGKLGPDEGGDVSPLYLLLNLGLSPHLLRILQSVLGSLAVALVFFIGRALFGRVTAWIALVLAGASAPLLLYEATLEPDLLILVADVAALCILVTRTTRRRLQPALIAGALLGLASAFRPSNLALLSMVVLWLGWSVRKDGWGRIFRVTGTGLISGALVLILPLGLVRASVGQQLAATMSVGEMLHICNRPEGNGIGYQSPSLVKLLEQQVRSHERPDPFHSIYRRFARAAKGPQISAVACEAYWVERTAAFVQNEPGAWLHLVRAKLIVFLAGPDAHDIAELRRAELALPIPPLVSFRFATAAGLAGLSACVLRRRRIAVLGPYLLAIVAVSLIFCVTSRYALMVLPVWCVLAGAFCAGTLKAMRRPRELIPFALALLVPLAISRMPELRASSRLVERASLSGASASEMERAARAGHLSEAEDAFVRAQAAQPFFRISRDLSDVPFERTELARASASQSEARFGSDSGADAYLQAKLFVLAGDCQSALPLTQRAAAAGFFGAVWDVALDPNLLAAECLLSRGDREGARERIASSLQRHPGTLTGLAWAAAAERTLGAQGGNRAERELLSLHDTLSAGYALSQALLAWGDPGGALLQADAVLRHLPEVAVVRYQRARSLIALGRTDDALEDYGLALSEFPAHGYETLPFDAAVAAKREANPNNPAVLALVAEHARRAGRLAEARDAAEKAASIYGVLAPQRLKDTIHWLEASRPLPQH
jgi:tetratricopeptide (TPR) repeat protein